MPSELIDHFEEEGCCEAKIKKGKPDLVLFWRGFLVKKVEEIYYYYYE